MVMPMTTGTEASWSSPFLPQVDPVVLGSSETALSQFDQTCERIPGEPALHYFDRTYDWAEVDDRSRRFASWLVRNGTQRGDRIAIWLQNVPEFIIAQLGIWRAGCALVPLNPMLREKEVTHQLQDSGARVLVAETSILESVTRRTIEDESSLEAVLSVAGPNEHAVPSFPHVQGSSFGEVMDGPIVDGVDLLAPRPGDVALLVYTSGTTGLPKAATSTHANVAFNAHVYRTWMRLGRSDVILGGAPLFHITGLLAGLSASYVTGCPLVLFYRFQPATCLEMIERWKTSFTVLPSTAIRALLDCGALLSSDISSLTKLYSGGAPIPARLADEWRAVTGQTLYSIYGLTETTSPSHAAPFGQPVRTDDESGMLSVGVPVQGAECKVVSESGDDVPHGSLGEIWIKGPMVVPGYWNNPDATASALADGYLHTGDVGKRDDDGWFYVVDRIKDMINASGFKVWPREVEDLLLSHPAVAEAAVVGVPDPYRGETVKAFVRLREGEGVSEVDIISWARQNMAAYKYPRVVEIVSELPMTASGKVLRRALRESSPDSGRQQSEVEGQ